MQRSHLKRHKAVVSVYLILEERQQFLLSLRHNTGFEDGKYGLVAGHVEENESAMHALIREVKEEIAIDIKIGDLTLCHAMHLKTDREDIALFYRCQHYQGIIQNQEPHKCQALSFFSLDALPSNMIDYIRQALLSIARGKIYSEIGW